MAKVGGSLLIAIPDLTDTNFHRTVVFVIEHTEEGAMGVVLNRPTPADLVSVWQKLDSEVHVTQPGVLFSGGPVGGPLIALHDQFSFSDTQIIEGVFMAIASERLNDLVASDDIQLRVFSGYSGWGPEQLDNEIDSGGWLVMPAEACHIFSDTETLYKNVCERFGAQIIFPQLGQNSRPANPGLN